METLTFSTVTVIDDPRHQQTLWAMYDEARRVTWDKSPTRQFLHEDEFFEHLTNPSIIKIIMRDGNEAIGLLLFTNNLENCPWLSIPFFESNFATELKAGTLFYNMTMAIKKSHQGSGVNKHMLRWGYQHIFSLGGIGFVDFSEKTTPGGAAWSQYMAQHMHAQIEIYDKQNYATLKPLQP